MLKIFKVKQTIYWITTHPLLFHLLYAQEKVNRRTTAKERFVYYRFLWSHHGLLYQNFVLFNFLYKDFINKLAGHPLVQSERCLHMFLTEPVLDKLNYLPGRVPLTPPWRAMSKMMIIKDCD